MAQTYWWLTSSLLAAQLLWSNQQRPALFVHGLAAQQQQSRGRTSKKPTNFPVADDNSSAPLPQETYRQRRFDGPREYRRNDDVGKPRELTSGQRIPDRVPSVVSDVLRRKEESKVVRNKSKEKPRSPNSASNDPARLEPPNCEPWKAGYYTSLNTQKRIKLAATGSKRRPLGRATNVLETFLSIPPEKSNEANLVCALTLSAKSLVLLETNEHFRGLLFRTTNILCDLLEKDGFFSTRQLCNAVWALAKHYDRDDSLLPSPVQDATLLDSNVHGKTETWDLRDDLVLSPAQRIDDAVDTIAKRLTAILEKDSRAAKEKELCMACWAYGILRRRRRPPGWQHGPLMGKLPQTIHESENQQIDPDYVVTFEQRDDSPCDEECHGLYERNPTDALLDKIAIALCQTVYAKTSNNETVTSFTRIRRFKWCELANVAWAFASNGRSCSHEAQELAKAIARESTRRLNEDGPEAKEALSRDIAQIIWSLGILQADNYHLADSLVLLVDAFASYASRNGMEEQFRAWSCADIVQVALSLAHARLDQLPMLRLLYAEALNRLDSDKLAQSSSNSEDRRNFLAWELSILLWAQARLHFTSANGEAFHAFSRKVVMSINNALKQGLSFSDIGVGPQEQANIAWSLTVLELYDSPDASNVLAAIFKEAAASCREQGVIQLEHAHQLWQALFLFEDHCTSCVESAPEWFRDYLQDKWYLEKARRKISSARHRSLSKTLSLMGVAHYNEHDEDIDVAIVLKPQASWTHETETSEIKEGILVAVEFDGPNHFTRQQRTTDGSRPESPRALGHTVLKYRLLRKQGWTVVRVPYYEFDRIPFWASMERQRYLQRLLKTHGNLRFSDADRSDYKAPVPNRQSRFD